VKRSNHLIFVTILPTKKTKKTKNFLENLFVSFFAKNCLSVVPVGYLRLNFPYFSPFIGGEKSIRKIHKKFIAQTVPCGIEASEFVLVFKSIFLKIYTLQFSTGHFLKAGNIA